MMTLAITHDPLCMRVPNQTELNLTQLNPTSRNFISDISRYAFNNSRMAGWIFMKFVLDVTLFEANPKFHFLIS
jgi:hypothetical protein